MDVRSVGLWLALLLWLLGFVMHNFVFDLLHDVEELLKTDGVRFGEAI